ncbi:MAG: hypothetical protein COV67_01375 [Nitrospinae bacterium CG11_big_fil_rev_8_21_14_0_20_56_8]|nr:MAG: hypothetical protein COV67_01375 [Nitrospinae bacterium CG11_big_fil_rev_8_21_14_0_20_56_8]
MREAGADLGLDELEIRSVPCMKRCGGGVSIQVSACNSLLKFKREEEAVNVLIPEKMIPVPA